jgi:hypothetical protein
VIDLSSRFPWRTARAGSPSTAPTSRFSVWAAVLALVAGTAWAHDPFEITADVRVRPETLTVDVAMARSTALAIATNVSEAPTFDPAKFGEHRAAFLQRAPSLFVLSSPQGPVAPTRTEVGLSVEGDVEFHLTYPPPASSPVRLEAPHLAKLGYGYGDQVRVRGPNGESLADKLLGATDPTVEFALPVAATATATPAAPASRIRSGAAAIAALFGLGLLWWANRHRAKAQAPHHDR